MKARAALVALVIVGATFDESLEGIIRVSVVATGIDKVALGQAAPAQETRAAEVAPRSKVETARYSEPRSNPVERPPVAAAMTAAAPAPVQTHQPTHAANPATVSGAGFLTPQQVEKVGIDAVSDALQPVAASEDVTIRPLARSKPSLLLDHGAGQIADIKTRLP